MRSLGAGKSSIALMFYAESGLLAVAAGWLGIWRGVVWRGGWGRGFFRVTGRQPLLNVVLLPVVVGLALAVAVAGSTPSIRAALRMDPSSVLRSDA